MPMRSSSRAKARPRFSKRAKPSAKRWRNRAAPPYRLRAKRVTNPRATLGSASGASNIAGTALPENLDGCRTGKAFMALDLLTIAGVAGCLLIVVAYFANQQGWLRAENWLYSLANLVGSTSDPALANHSVESCLPS
ncbi:MAG: CBU_0592 family membrane protein [Methyloceanibacter sp.]